MRVDLGGRDVGMAEKRLQHAEVGAARQQVGREGVAKHVRTDPLGCNAGVGSKPADDLKQPDAAEVRFAAGKQPGPLAVYMLEPALDGGFGARGDWYQTFLAP